MRNQDIKKQIAEKLIKIGFKLNVWGGLERDGQHKILFGDDRVYYLQYMQEFQDWQKISEDYINNIHIDDGCVTIGHVKFNLKGGE